MSLTREIRMAIRTLWRAPGSAAVAVFALGVGIGLCTLIFSIMQGAMLRGLPFEEPHEIVTIERTSLQRGGRIIPTIHDYAAWSEGNRSFDALGAYTSGTVNLSGGADEIPERMRGAYVTPSVLELLGVTPVIGRRFTAADDAEGAPPVILLGWDVWQRRFEGDRGIVGGTVRTNGIESTVIGVLPEGFGFPESHQVWRPLRLDASRVAWSAGRVVQVVGRLRNGGNVDAATADLARIAARIAEEHPETHRDMSVRVAPFGALSEQDRAMIFIMMGAVFAVLAIACVNVANLLIGRAIARTKEVGIRMALGASRLRVALPFLAESTVLAVLGALLGVAVAYAGLGVFNRSVEIYNPPFWMFFFIDGAVLSFVAVASGVAAVLAGVIPAWQAARLSLHDTLKDESRGATGFRLGRLSRGLVVAEVALSLGLLVGAGLMIRSVLELNTFDLGVPAEEIFVARVALPEADYGDAEARRRFAVDLLARLETVPGARHVALSSTLLGSNNFNSSTFVIEGEDRAEGSSAVWATTPIISSGYFEALDAGPIRGRGFTPSDDVAAPPVAIVNRAFERRYFPEGEVLGRRIRIGGEDQLWLTVVGVAPDLPETGVRNFRPEAIYRPMAQSSASFLSVLVRMPSSPLSIATAVRDHVLAIDPDLPLYDAKTLRGAVKDANFLTGIMGGLFGAFGAAALVLASVGLYGVMTFSVGQRRREVGVRMAIGATPANVLSLILMQGMRHVLIGLAIGAVLAFAMSRGIASTLFAVSPQDPLTLAVTALLLVGVAALACSVPALRAARTDPLDALRAE